MTTRHVIISSNGSILIGSEVFLNSSNTNYFFSAARVSDTRAIVAFVDVAMNNALWAALVEVQNGNPVFGSTIIVNNGHASGKLPDGLWLFMSVSVLSSKRFVVVYSDLANDGCITSWIGEITRSGDLVAASPEYVISMPNPDEMVDYYWVSSAALSEWRFLIVDALSGTSGKNGGKVALGEMKPPPAGLALGLSGNKQSEWDVVVSGVVELQLATPLKKGKRYFATTKGDLMIGDDIDFLSSHTSQYITNGDMIISLSSYVGIAVSEKQILLK